MSNHDIYEDSFDDAYEDSFDNVDDFEDIHAYLNADTTADTVLPGCTLLSGNDGYFCQADAENEKICMAYKCPFTSEDSNLGRPIWNQRKEMLRAYINSSGLAEKCKAYGGKYGPSVYTRLGQREPNGTRSSHAIMFSCSEIEGGIGNSTP